MRAGGSGGLAQGGGGGGAIVQAKYFGMHIADLSTTNIWFDVSGVPTANASYTQTPWPNINIGMWRSWDSNGCSWRNVERTNGAYTWDRFNVAITSAKNNGSSIIIELGAGPDWATTLPGIHPGYYAGYNPNPPANNADWGSWCTAVATNLLTLGCPGAYYEVWNEVNDPTLVVGSGYTGTVSELVALSHIARTNILAIDPTAKIISPSIAGQDAIDNGSICPVNMDAFLAAGGGQWCDIIAMHGYNSLAPLYRPESIITFGVRAKALMKKYALTIPIWNTEWGFGPWMDSSLVVKTSPNSMPTLLASAYVTRMLICNWLAGFSNMCFYAFDAVGWSSITMLNTPTDTTTLLAPALAFKYCAQTLTNGYLSNFSTLVDASKKTYYSSSFTSGSGKTGLIVWADDYSTASIPVTGYVSVTDNLGNMVIVNGNLTITGSPQFVYYS